MICGVRTEANDADTVCTLGHSSFDLQVEGHCSKPSSTSIPISLLPLLVQKTEYDPDLGGVGFNIVRAKRDYRSGFHWKADELDEMADSELPSRLRPDGYLVKYHSAGREFFFPNGDKDRYYASCSYHPSYDELRGCVVVMRYAFDSQIRLNVRVRVLDHDEIPDFKAIALKAHRFVQCELDVTPENSLRTRRPDTEIMPETMASCEPTDT